MFEVEVVVGGIDAVYYSGKSVSLGSGFIEIVGNDVGLQVSLRYAIDSGMTERIHNVTGQDVTGQLVAFVPNSRRTCGRPRLLGPESSTSMMKICS